MTKVCKNPECRRVFTPGHYGKKQVVCGLAACRAWYRVHWRATRRPPRGIPDADYRRILAALAPNDPLLHSLVVCARETGLRKGELLGLTWGDVMDGDKVKPVVDVQGQWQDGLGFKATKTHRSRLGLFSAAARDALAKHRRSLASSRGKVASGARVWPVSEAWAWGRWVALQDALGVQNPVTKSAYRFHDLRHTLATELVNAGRMDLAKKMLDHRRLDTTMIYSETSPEDTLADVESIRGKNGRKV